MGTLVIYDPDEGYAQKIMEFISEKRNLPFSVAAFSEEDAFYDYVSKQGAELLLVSDSATGKEALVPYHDRCVVLSSGDRTFEGDFPIVYKYQSAEEIFRTVLGRYADLYEEDGIVSAQKSDTRIIGVYSPIGRTGRTSFSMTLGQVLLKDGSVLYINMEEFSGFSRIFSKEYSNDLSDLMYYYRQSPETIAMRLEAFVEDFHGMDYIPPMRYSPNIRNVAGDCWTRMILDIAAAGAYDTVILDLSNMPDDVFGILEICGSIYMPIDDDRMSMCKISEYEEFLLKTGRSGILKKTAKVKLPGVAKKGWDENYIEELLWSEFGDFVRRLILQEATS